MLDQVGNQNVGFLMTQLICICENNGANQFNLAEDQYLCFCYIDSMIPLLPKSQISSLLWQYHPVSDLVGYLKSGFLIMWLLCNLSSFIIPMSTQPTLWLHSPLCGYTAHFVATQPSLRLHSPLCVATQPSLCLAWSEIPKTGFLATSHLF